MNTNEPRRTFNLRLKPYEAAMLQRAIEKLGAEKARLQEQGHWCSTQIIMFAHAAEKPQWLIAWAVLAFCRAIVNSGEVPAPFACDLRSETPDEKADRIGPEKAQEIIARNDAQEEKKVTAWHHPGRGQLGPIGPDFDLSGTE